jgi:hypothetical protein
MAQNDVTSALPGDLPYACKGPLSWGGSGAARQRHEHDEVDKLGPLERSTCRASDGDVEFVVAPNCSNKSWRPRTEGAGP